MCSTLKDVSYSIKQNGIMINLDYTEPIDDDDIIGWKSDRGWVYLTLLGVRAPKNKIPQDNFSGAVRKIVIDDFDESTQLAILVRKPILGYDIINSKTSPSTIVFIHTEMKKSEVANLKKHIKKDGTSVFNLSKSSGFPRYNTNFKNAFDEARRELGPNAIFEYHGNLYTTNHPGEKDAISKSVLMKKSITPYNGNDENQFAIREPSNNFSNENFENEIYTNIETGDTLTKELDIVNKLENNSFTKNDKGNSTYSNDDDGWFSGLFPAYKKSNQSSPIPQENINQIDSIVIKEKPILVESLVGEKKRRKRLKDIFNIFNRKKDKNIDSDEIQQDLVEKEEYVIKSSDDNKELQKQYIPTEDKIIIAESLHDNKVFTPKTQLPDSTTISSIDHEKLKDLTISDYRLLQKKYIPDYLQVDQDTILSINKPNSPTQAPDTNIVQAWFIDESIIPDEYDATRLQERYVPSRKNNEMSIPLDEPYESDIFPGATQAPDTNIVQAWFIDESIIPDDYDATRLQERYVPSRKNNELSIASEESYPHDVLPGSTQAPDTNIVQAWFIDESIISDEYDATRLQERYVPSRKSNELSIASEEIYNPEVSPQVPEFTDPIIIDRREKTTFKNRGFVKAPKPNKETPFKIDTARNNTWLSYFPRPDDSAKNHLKWDFKNEREVPQYLQEKREALDERLSATTQDEWRQPLPNNKPKSFPRRQSDPAFMYYHNGGIRVESNIDGVPIYIDGKYVGETPMSRPVQVEPGWHQVSGFSPVYTNLASKKRLQFVSYDSIIQNNESFGAKTVYAEAGKLETVMLRFNKMGDKPKKLIEIKGGYNVGIPMFVFVMTMILYSL